MYLCGIQNMKSIGYYFVFEELIATLLVYKSVIIFCQISKTETCLSGICGILYQQ